MSGYTILPIDHRPFSRRIDATRIEGVKLPKRPHEAQAKGYRASAIAHCLRSVGYRLLNVPASDETYNPNYENAADMGTTLHVNFQKHLLAADMLYVHPKFGAAVELSLAECCDPAWAEIRKDLALSGHIDAIVTMRDGAYAAWDLKTVEASYLAPGNRYLAEKLQGYACQVNLYAHLFATHAGQKTVQSFVFVVSRNKTSDRALYSVPYQPDLAVAELARVAAAKARTDVGELPEPEPERGPCVFCNWRSLCPAGRRGA